MLWARESNSYRSRGSLHGSRYSRSGATRKGEKAMAGQRKTPTTGAVTVSEPTDRQTPKRAGSAVVTHSRKSGTPVGSGSQVLHLKQFPHCVESCETLFLKADRRGSHASGRLKLRVSHPCLAALRWPSSALAFLAFAFDPLGSLPAVDLLRRVGVPL
jgi:hypothetical protein